MLMEGESSPRDCLCREQEESGAEREERLRGLEKEVEGIVVVE